MNKSFFRRGINYIKVFFLLWYLWLLAISFVVFMATNIFLDVIMTYEGLSRSSWTNVEKFEQIIGFN